MNPVISDRKWVSDSAWRALALNLARRQAGLIAGSALVDWAVEALVRGWEGRALSVLAGLPKPPNEFDVDRFISEFFAELNEPQPLARELAELHPVLVAADIVATRTTPYEASRELYALWVAEGCSERLAAWGRFDDAYELARDGVYGRVEDVESEIRNEAARMLEEADPG